MEEQKTDYSKSNYKTCLLSYIDVLGFKNKVKSNSCSQIAGSLNNFIEYSNEEEKFKNLFGFHHIAFSDTALRIYEITDKPIGLLLFEITNIGMIQCSQIVQENLIRGCITYGDMFYDKNMFFGQTLIDAHEYESNNIHNPFIALHPKIIEVLNNKNTVYNLLVKNNDYQLLTKYINRYRGKFYIDYLSVLFSVLDSKENAIEVLKIHKSLIIKNIEEYQDKKNVLRKYVWMKNYHNSFIGRNKKLKEIRI